MNGGGAMPREIDIQQCVFARCLIARFRRRAVAEREAVSGYWSKLADQLEARLLKRTGWTR